LCFSYEQMVDEGRILDDGDYHKGNLYILKSTAREYVKGLKKGRQKEERMSNPLEEGKTWKEIIEILKKEKKEIWFTYSKDRP
jgi:cell division protein YceG involved in septum cleavage